MLDYKQLREIHVELTERCNASCPMCGRFTSLGDLNPHLRHRQLTLMQVKSIIFPDLLKSCKKIRICGNFGDPMLATDLLAILFYFTTTNPKLKLRLNTNGSLRNESWWQGLATYFMRPKSYVQFAIDGLQDTHAIYRRGTNFSTVMRNASAFINAGGRAHWAFLAFKHNEHQIETARALAEQLGFERFTVKATKRFQKSSNLKWQAKLSIGGNQSLEPPENPQWQHPLQTQGTEDFATTQTISCQAIKKSSIYISAQGLVTPCCWLASNLYQTGSSNSEFRERLDHFGGIDTINCFKSAIPDIIESPLFRSGIPTSYINQASDLKPLKTCERICGNHCRSFEKQFVERQEWIR
jgi:MoaA/NifB/PqqE/SkfB family radical SAM enzyme